MNITLNPNLFLKITKRAYSTFNLYLKIEICLEDKWMHQLSMNLSDYI